jgi:hypothetical protein
MANHLQSKAYLAVSRIKVIVFQVMLKFPWYCSRILV